MPAELAWQLGLGAVLGWAALPLCARWARRSHRASPAEYYRALVAALAVAAGLSFTPALRGLLGLAIELPRVAQPWPEVDGISLVGDWVTPLVGTRAEPWPSTPLARALSALGLLWLGAILLGVVRSLAGRARLAQRYRGAATAPPHVLERAAHVAAELGITPPSIRVADGVASAFTFGFFSPLVVLGPSAAGASDEELEFVLRHELWHVARGDARVAFHVELAARCFPFHPSLRALDREIRFAREAAVDEAAAGTRSLHYARFLLGLAEQLDSGRRAHASLMMMANTALERRIEMLMSKKQGARVKAGAGGLGLGLAGLALGALVLLAPASFAQNGHGGRAGHTRVDGNLSVAQVEQVVFASSKPALECYARLAAPRDNLQLRLLFEIAENGSVASGRVEVAEHPELGPCFESALRSLVFPAPSSGRVKVDMQAELSPPLQERNARAEAKEGVSHRLAPEVIRTVVRENYGAFRLCYEALPEPRPATRAKLSFTIGRDGSVVDGEVESPEYPSLGRCLDPAMRAMRFPEPKDGIVTVGYPLEFSGEPPADSSTQP